METRPPYERTTTVVTPRPAGFIKRISWSAVFAGVLIAIIIQIMFSLLGVGIGLSTLDFAEERNPAAGLGIGSGIWYGLTLLLALFAGGWVAGRLSSAPRSFDGIIHGLLTWSLTTLLTLYFISSTVGRVIGGVSRFVGGTLSTVGTAASAGLSKAAPEIGDAIQKEAAAQGFDVDNLKSEFRKILRQTGDADLNPDRLEQKAEQAGDQAEATAERAASNPQGADEEADGLFDKLFKEGQSTVNQVDRDDAVNVLMKRTGKSRAEAEKTVDGYITTYQQARAKFEETRKEVTANVRDGADTAAGAASTAAIMTFFGLLIGAGASGFGAKKGAESKDDYNDYDRPVRETV